MRIQRVVSLLLAAALALPAGAADAPVDPDVDKGIRLVDDGDYDAAIVTLDAAARRLATDPARGRDLSQAYLYLGIAYVGKGHEAAAKAKFREAVSRIKDLTLSPDRYPPKVIDLFEAARDEAQAAARAAPAPAPVASAPDAASGGKKGGGSKTLLIVGGVAAAGGVAALAMGGGGSSSRAVAGSGPGPSGQQQLQQSAVVPAGQQQFFTFTTTRAGTVEVKLSWQTRAIKLDIACQDQNPPYTDCGGRYTRTTDTTANYTFSASQKSYLVAVGNYEHPDPRASEPFTIQILYP